jgi:DNA replication protein DnaC
VFDTFWTKDADDWIERWGERPFCAEHGRLADAAAVKLRIANLVRPIRRMSQWTFATFPADDVPGRRALKAAAAYLDELGEWEPWLFVFGGVGSGKTGLALSCLRAYIEGRHGWDDVGFCNVRQLLAQTRGSFASKGASDPTETAIKPWLCVLDDVGAERPTPWALETLSTIVEARYVANYPTIVTSNYAPAELAERLGHDDIVIGQRIVSRLTENALQIRLDRPDLRARGAA